MTSLASRGGSSVLLRIGIAILSQAGWLALGDVIPNAPAFEQETEAGSSARYWWHNRNIQAQLAIGGGISFRFNDGHELEVRFPGAKTGAEPLGESASYPVSYYLASDRSPRAGIRWERVRYREIYPGIDLVLVTKAGDLEFVFEIRPGGDPRKIRIRYPGAAVRLNQQGDLVIRTADQQVQQRRAFAFQGRAFAFQDKDRSVECSYSLGHDVTLQLGPYDSRRMLTIDPVLNFSTYLGGAGYDAINAMTTDSFGNIY